ncbi:MlaD family protein [Vibrio sp. JC009]|uniref:MlaD family protein n=1 Tax=Vibrio sp. JC009 TaxID=2912314 RepID=UPI0023B0BBCE|nr:MlaD family protein [Vibrio sp. JC009]WED23158.1 MlaD family protein [Vibrio sp. JC009]
MSETERKQKSYSPKVKKDFGISPLWILPLVTIALAGWLVVKAINDSGQRIQIYFSDAQGLVAGRTTIQYQGLEVGMVKNISLAPDLTSIYVDADIYPQATQLLGDNTRFWLVKPVASISGISGLDALVSGNYISIDPGEKTDSDELKTEYVALDGRPSDLQAEEGLNVTLISKNLGSISVGSQIIYKKIPIGEVFSYSLDEEANNVLIKAYIKNDFAHIITDKSRFWNVSGVGANIGFDGIDVHFESLSAMLVGAIAVDSPDGGEAIEQDRLFKLYPDLKTAGRGIPIEIKLPDNSGISPNGGPIMYRGLRIGEVNKLSLSEERDHIIASAAIQPAFVDILTTRTKFILEEAEISVSGVENIANLVKGNFLSVIPGEGEQSRQFTVIKKKELLSQQPHSVTITLTGEDSYAIYEGAEVLYRGIPVGSITKIALADEKVQFTLLIDAKYSQLIKTNNRFYVTGLFSASIEEGSLNIDMPPMKRLVTESISFISEGKPGAKPVYHLHGSRSLAEIARYDESGTQIIRLFANELPSVSKGAPLLYRNMKVGKISGYKLTAKGVDISAKIEKRYRHLIKPDTVFWNRSGVEIDASLSGIHVKASPLQAMIKGGIAFDSIPGIENKINKRWKLYADYKQASRYGKEITLLTTQSAPVSEGTPIKFQGVSIGEVSRIVPDFDNSRIEIKARIMPEYLSRIATSNSYFWLVSPEVGLSGIKNLDTLVANYISVKPRKGKPHYEFDLNEHPFKASGVRYILQSESRDSIEAGTPVLFRDFEVGHVISVELGTFADRVITTIEIDHDYAYLVRKNSVFWNTSGLNVSLGLSGAEIKAGTVDSLIRGGITFATPEGSSLAPVAEVNRSFYLHSEAKDEWKEWRTPIPGK